MTQIKLRFLPQVWINDYAVPCDPEGTTEFEVAESSISFDFENDHYERDELRFDDNAPDWVKEWSGPFEIERVVSQAEFILSRP